MRISDWSSDVCSSDLLKLEFPLTPSRLLAHIEGRREIAEPAAPPPEAAVAPEPAPATSGAAHVEAPVHNLPTPSAPQEQIVSNGAVVVDGDWKFVLSTPMGDRKSTRLNSSH